MTPDELHARAVAGLERRRDEALRVSRHHRQLQAKAKAAGDDRIASKLGMLAAHLEQCAALAEAERRDRIARYGKLRSQDAARAASKTARQTQAAADAARVAQHFAAAWRDGMGRVALQAATQAVVRDLEQREQQRLATMQQAGNRDGARRASAALEALRRQAALITLHRAGQWLKSRAPPGGGERQ